MKKLSFLVSKLYTGCLRKASLVKVPYTKSWLEILDILYKEGFIQNYIIADNKIYIYFRYLNGKNSIRMLKNLIKPSHMIYTKYKNLWLFRRSSGILILSTIHGIRTHEECLKEKLGGKLLLFVA